MSISSNGLPIYDKTSSTDQCHMLLIILVIYNNDMIYDGHTLLQSRNIRLKIKQVNSNHFQSRATRLYKSLCRSVGWLVGWAVGWSVGPVFAFLAVLSILSHFKSIKKIKKITKITKIKEIKNITQKLKKLQN